MILRSRKYLQPVSASKGESARKIHSKEASGGQEHGVTKTRKLSELFHLHLLILKSFLRFFSSWTEVYMLQAYVDKLIIFESQFQISRVEKHIGAIYFRFLLLILPAMFVGAKSHV